MTITTAFGNIFSNITNLLGFNTDYFFESQSRLIGQKGAIYLDIEEPYKIFNENPSVNQVIRKKSNMFANMELKLVDKNGELIEDADFQTFFSNPNIYQSLNSFLRSYIEQKDVYGNSFIYKNQSSTLQKYPTSLTCLSPRYLKPILTGKVFDQVSMKDVVSKYELINYNENSVQYFDTDTILWIRNTDLDNPLVGVSPLKSLKYPITNTKLAYDYLNAISGEKGAIGILSDDNRSPMGGMPLRDEEKANIENSYSNSYGVRKGQRKVIVTKSALKWQPMTYPTRDLLLLEQIDEYFLTIIDHFGLNVNLFSSKSQTYENIKNSIIQVYQDTIIPEADQFCQDLTKFLNIQNGNKIVPSYAHVSILQDNNNVSDNLVQLVQANILTPAQAQNILQTEQGVEIPENVQTSNVADRLSNLSPIVANNMLSNLTVNEIRSLIGLPPVANGDTIQQNNTSTF